MGTSASPLQLGAKLSRVATDLGQQATQMRAAKAAADVAVDIYNDEARKAGLSVGSTLAGKTWPGYVATARTDSYLVQPRGPVHLHNNPNRRHFILARGARTNLFAAGPVLPGMARPVAAQAGRRRRSAGKQALAFGDQRAAIVNHPGTRGARWASKAVEIIERKAPEAYQREQSSVWRAVFK